MEDDKLDKNKVVYKDLSYRIVGILFEVFNELGYGYQEKYYEKAIILALKQKNIRYHNQVAHKVIFQNQELSKIYLDFLIEDKIILEIKKGPYFPRGNIEQVHKYLKATNKKLAILANFTPNGVKFKRILNIKNL